jgi:hypothetical protein
LDDHPLEIEGAWIRICGRLYWTGGTGTRTLKEWAAILRKNITKTEQILKYFQEKNICDLVNQNGNITITSRRMVRDAYIARIRKEAGSKGGNPNLKSNKSSGDLLNQNDEQNPTPSVSVSFASSVKTKKTFAENDFSAWWSLYPKRNGRRVGKQECILFWKDHLKEQDIEPLMAATRSYASTVKQGYARDPIRFLKKDYWKDFTSDTPPKPKYNLPPEDYEHFD